MRASDGVCLRINDPYREGPTGSDPRVRMEAKTALLDTPSPGRSAVANDRDHRLLRSLIEGRRHIFFLDVALGCFARLGLIIIAVWGLLGLRGRAGLVLSARRGGTPERRMKVNEGDHWQRSSTSAQHDEPRWVMSERDAFHA